MSRTLQAFESWIYAVLVIGLLSFMQTVDAAHGLPFKLPPSFASFKPLRLDSEEKRWLQEHGKLRVGITIDDYEPIDITNDRNRYQGISADYLSIIRDKLGAEVEVLGYRKRDQAVAELLAGKIDVLTSASGFERGIEGIEFSQHYMVDQPVIVGRDSESESIVEWAGKKIGFVDGYIDIQAAHAFYPDSEIIITPNMHSAMEALIEGDIDAFIGNEIIVQAFKSIRPFSRLRIIDDSAIPVSGFAFATRLADRQLTYLINQVLDSVDDTLSELILSRWTHGLEGSIAQQHIDLLPNEREWIKANPVVTVVSQQFPLYTFKNAVGEWEGLSIDILARISRMTGLQFVHEESFSTAQTLSLLKSGQGQMNATLSISPERKAFLNFTYSYGGAPWVFIVRTHDSRLGSLEQLSGKVLALPARHALEAMIRREHPEVEIRTVASFDQARSLVEKGEADATIQSETQAYLYPPGRLKVGRTVDGRWSADTFSVHVKHPELLSIVNKALEAMTMTEIRTLRSKWLGGVGKAPFVEGSFYHSPWLYVPVTALLVAGLVLFLCNRRLHKQIRLGQAREAQLREGIHFQRRYLDGIPSPIFVVGVKGELVTCNRSYEERLSVKLERIQGLTSLEVNLYPPPLAEQLHQELLSVIRSRKPFYKKRVLVFKACSTEIYQWTVPFYSSTGQLEGLVGGWFDGAEFRKWALP
ncbi:MULTISPECIES: transporter substrate-binding domain-containing protein [unclassified Pseudomonas]|uniref:transporter substrate-binding domain-containing protein n=1 Tax=unclassified Pseudomonas TaxID=196821 RepID=UPI001473ACE3|nr:MULTISPECIES: transporter substrate-binding domain-containing protein [unclassified Pseudomonas]NMY37657.1 transporter substrate-binding domain-containing protein [Pseudomonas sp. WS 5078]NMY60398.1 transporter substrate-binding domain-containing protein [Pseudomonas sp. WS 5354]